jgi:hypothetical protein
MPDRYQRRGINTNENDLYRKTLEKKGVKRLVHYTTPVFPEVTAEMRSQLIRQKYIWKLNDSYQKLSQAFYGDPRYWWVLAWYNKKPTDGLVKIGDVIRIPRPLERVLEFFEV